MKFAFEHEIHQTWNCRYIMKHNEFRSAKNHVIIETNFVNYYVVCQQVASLIPWKFRFSCTKLKDVSIWFCAFTTILSLKKHESINWKCGWHNIRATLHTRLKALDHGNVRALIGQKCGDCPSSLHTRRWRPKGPKKSLWMKSLHGVLHGWLWIRVHGLPEFASNPPPRGGFDVNFGRPLLFKYFF